jgi:hypothetical protein
MRLAVVLLLALSACATYRDQLSRSQRAFENNEYDRSLSLLRDLEPNMTRLSVPEQAEYAYLRGMNDYRIGFKSEARHWLSLAKAYEDNSAGMLAADWKVRVNEALGELNGVVYSDGVTALSNTRRSADEPEPAKAAPAASSAAPAPTPAPVADAGAK